MGERVVVALGGNALIRQGDRGTVTEQAVRSLAAMQAVAQMVIAERQIVITHGNGPTVGNILIRQQLARHVTPPMPLDVCGAESQGNIGYLLERALIQVLQQRGIQRPVATLLSLVEVDPHDPAFAQPSKPVGPFLSAVEAEELGRSVPVTCSQTNPRECGSKRAAGRWDHRHHLRWWRSSGCTGQRAAFEWYRSSHRQGPVFQSSGP